MNRMEEYQALRATAEQPAAGLEDTLTRARKRLRRRRAMVLRPLTGLAACFAVFVILVNFCAPVAYACSKVPGLRELAEAVTFSRSLTDAVNNEYVQPIDLKQTQNGITASVEYLIVDQKQVNVFFRMDSDQYSGLGVDPDVSHPDGKERIGSCSWGLNDWDVPNGELQSVTLEVFEGDVPDCILLELDVYLQHSLDYTQPPEPSDCSDVLFEDHSTAWERDYLAQFDFQLSFDPTFTAKAKIYPVEQTVELDGNSVTIRQVEVYPTHLRVIVEDDANNAAELQRLYFYIETDWGMKFNTESNGTVSFSTVGSPVTTYRADSTYFYKADHLRMVITGAEWLDRDMETVYVNLATGETDPLPEGVEFLSAEKYPEGWIVTFKAEQRKWSSEADMVSHQLFSHSYVGADGTEGEIRSWTSGGTVLEEAEWETHFTEQFPLTGYHNDEVWLKPQYSHTWQAENPVIITIQ